MRAVASVLFFVGLLSVASGVRIRDTPCETQGGQCTDVSESCNGQRKSGLCPGTGQSIKCCLPSSNGNSQAADGNDAKRVVEQGGSVESKRILVDTQDAGADDPLRGNGGTGNNLIIKWNDLPNDGKVDIVVHLHGYSSDPVTEKKILGAEAIAGLDLSGRTRPTVGLLPRGKKINDHAWTHPTVLENGKFDALIDYALRKLETATGTAANSLSKNRVIITGHSGAGGQLFKLAKLVDPHEVHVFDATYYDTAPLIDWMKKHIPEDTQATADMDDVKDYFANTGHVMRMVYHPNSGTASIAESTAKAIKKTPQKIAPWYHVQPSNLSHNDIPKNFGPKFLADNGCCE